MWQGKRVYLIGAGKSGLAAAGWLHAQGAQVCLNDQKPLTAFGEESRDKLSCLAGNGLILELGVEADPIGWGAEMVITSPGVPIDTPAIEGARSKGIPVTNEIELGWRVSHARIIGVTGSNGKTTTTSLIGQVLENAGYSPFVGGNIGVPFIQAAPDLGESDWAVLELSSFQLAGLLTLRPRIAVFLNLTPDHLDWHKSFANYAAAKWNIARFQEQDDWLILNYEDPLLRQEGEKRLQNGEAWIEGRPPARGPRILWFSQSEKPWSGVFIDQEGWVAYKQCGKTNRKEVRIMPIGMFALPGRHNRENLLAALGAGLALGISPYSLRQGASLFQGIEHRLETVCEHKGVLYVNDSKATNPDSAIKALDSYTRPILLIAGGDGKGASFCRLAEKIVEKAKSVVLIGKDRDRIEEALQSKGFTDIQKACALEEAVAACHALAEPGDVVLLAPACASLDMFSDYEERGSIFKEAVRSLIAE